MLAGCGAAVVAISRTQADVDSLRAETDCQTILADICDANEARRVAEEAGAIELLVNNAGIARIQPFLETTVEAFDETIAVNLRAALVISQVVTRGMIARGSGGAIVNVSSQASQAALKDHASYGASKAGLDHLTRIMALELGAHNIRVNVVNPTVILTPTGDPVKGGPMLARIPLGRFGKPIHVADAVAFLLSDQASMIHGVTLLVDGGYQVG